jgi:hypothetical protein
MQAMHQRGHLRRTAAILQRLGRKIVIAQVKLDRNRLGGFMLIGHSDILSESRLMTELYIINPAEPRNSPHGPPLYGSFLI